MTDVEDFVLVQAALLTSLIKALSLKGVLDPAEMGKVFDDAYVGVAQGSPERAVLAEKVFTGLLGDQFIAPKV